MDGWCLIGFFFFFFLNQDFDFDTTKKKKRRPKVEDRAAEEEKPEEEPTASNEEGEEKVADDDDVDFGKKKPKKKKEGASWATSDRDYDYTELLDRIFNLLNENNPDLVKAKKNRYVMKPPQVVRDGTKKTVWVNFQEICKTMHRGTEHVLAYTLAELGTSGSIDGNHRLVIKGRFQPKQIESVVRHYVGEYVSCRTCKSPDTILKKENRLYFIQCKSCGSSRSVAPIKQGFVAQVGKRKKQ